MKNNVKPIWKIMASVFTVLIMLTLLTSAVSAQVNVQKTPLGAGTPPATQRLSCKHNLIAYTAVDAPSSDSRVVQFKSLCKDDVSYIAWNFGDDGFLDGTKITPQLENPVHKFPKKGYYISCMTVRCKHCGTLLWVHNNIYVK